MTTKKIDPNQDQSQVPDGATEDATEVQERTRRTRADRPQQGERRAAHLRGKVSSPVELDESGNRAEAMFSVTGGFFNPNNGQNFDEPKEWQVRLSGYQAKQAEASLKEGDEIVATGFWLPTQRPLPGMKLDSIVQAFEISRPLDAAPSLTVAPPSVADGGMGAAL